MLLKDMLTYCFLVNRLFNNMPCKVYARYVTFKICFVKSRRFLFTGVQFQHGYAVFFRNKIILGTVYNVSFHNKYPSMPGLNFPV
jgi:hypothetical protein